MKNKKIHPAIPAVMALFLVAGCGGAKDANEKNFSKAVSESLEKKKELCLGLIEWPKDFDEGNFPSLQKDAIRRMEVLKSAGLVASEELESEPRNHYGKPRTFKVTRYTLTEKGKNSSKTVDTYLGPQQDICYGKKSLAKIVKWMAPSEFSGITHTKITYLYKIDDLPAWTSSKEFKEAFPHAARAIAGAEKEEETSVAVLMNTGWEAK